MDWSFIFGLASAISTLVLLIGGIFAGIIWLIKFVLRPVEKDIDHIKSDIKTLKEGQKELKTDFNSRLDKIELKIDSLKT